MRWLIACSFAFVTLGCGGSEETAAPRGGSHDLPDGTRVAVEAGGALELSLDGRPLFATSGAAFELRTFNASIKSLLGSWQFQREDERVREVGKLAKSSGDGERVSVGWSGSGGARVSATLSPLRAGATLIRLEASGVAGLGSVSIPLRCDADSSFYGFGEQYSGKDHRGEAFPLFVSEQGIGRTGKDNTLGVSGGPHSTYYPMPYFLDARGQGLLLRTARRTLVDLCQSDPSTARIEVESGEPFELVVFHGPTPYDVIRELGDEVGRPARPPTWAFGQWVAVQGGRDTVLAEVDALGQAQVPVTAIWSQDWTGARTNAGGGYGVQYRWAADATLYPDLAGMVSTLHVNGIRFLAYVNPFVMPNLEHFADMDAQGLLIRDESGKTYLHASPAGDASHPDLSSPKARAYVKAALSKIVTDYGVDGWMADFGEWVPTDAVPSDGSDPIAFHDAYPALWHSVSRETMEGLRPDGDWAVFSRSGWAGDQAASQITWAGDQECTWSKTDGLPTVVPALLDLGLSAVPFSTHDIGGFSGGPRDKELWMRWVELGAFTPTFRTHEGNQRDQNWQWDGDAETVAHFARFARIHQALVPEIEALADEAAVSSKPLVRHLFLEFPDDPGCRGVSDELMLGPDLLVAPVLEPGATEREVYLPPGKWFDVWTGDEHDGAGSISVTAPIGSPPVFSRGSDRSDLRQIQ